MRHQLVLKQGLLSEKAYRLMESGVYTFLVSAEASKGDIKKAVEYQFGTKVIKVNVLGKKSKKRRVTGTRKTVETGAGKKALVYLKPGEKIALLSPKSESKKPKDTKKVSKELKGEEETKTENKGLLSRITKLKKHKKEDK